MSFSAVLLAGGESSRMGVDKATIPFRGMPLWKLQLATLRAAQPQQIFVSARTDPAWRPPDVHFVADEPPSRGPLSGIVAAMARLTNSHLLVLAIDLPFMSAEFLRDLSESARPGFGLVPTIKSRPEPLAAIYPVEILPDLTAAFSGNDYSLQSMIKNLVVSGRLKLVRVENEKHSLFRNLNAPADLAQL